MITKDIWTVDAFTTERYKGNPCAVVFDGDDLSADQMQRIAAEMNLSETVFLLPPTVVEADYRARIFTPRAELPFAGHPTISAAFAMVSSGRFAPEGKPPIIRQECGAGIIPVEIRGDGESRAFTMTQVQARFRAMDPNRAAVAEALNCPIDDVAEPALEAVSTGVWWSIARLSSPEALAALSPDMGRVGDIGTASQTNGICAFSIGALAKGCSVKLRAFAPHLGVPEDPVTGSANGCVAAYIARHGLMEAAPLRYTAEQGTELGRDGRVSVEVTGEHGTEIVRVGGSAVKVLEGKLFI